MRVEEGGMVEAVDTGPKAKSPTVRGEAVQVTYQALDPILVKLAIICGAVILAFVLAAIALDGPTDARARFMLWVVALLSAATAGGLSWWFFVRE